MIVEENIVYYNKLNGNYNYYYYHLIYYNYNTQFALIIFVITK